MPRSEPSEASATAFVLASSLFRSLTNCVVSRTSVSRLSFCASAALDSAKALARSARLRLQPATDTAIRTRSAVDLIRSLLRVDRMSATAHIPLAKQEERHEWAASPAFLGRRDYRLNGA